LAPHPGDRVRADTELGTNPVRVEDLASASIELHDSITAHALAEILVRGHDQHLLDPRVTIGDSRSGAERIVGFVLDHRPDRESRGSESALHDRDLLQDHRIHAGAGLVAGPELVAEALDRVVRRDADVGGAVLDQCQRGGNDPGGRRERSAVTVS
jgi:hypothetical protein